METTSVSAQSLRDLMSEPLPSRPVADMQNNYDRIAAAVPSQAYVGSVVSGGRGYMPPAVRSGCLGLVIVPLAILVRIFTTW
jgi:hypothetical protein